MEAETNELAKRIHKEVEYLLSMKNEFKKHSASGCQIEFPPNLISVLKSFAIETKPKNADGRYTDRIGPPGAYSDEPLVDPGIDYGIGQLETNPNLDHRPALAHLKT